MSSSTTNDITKWSDEWIHENKYNNNNLYKKKSVESQRRAEAEAKACTEEVARAHSSVSGPSKGKQPKAAASRAAEVMEQAGPSPVLRMLRCWGSVQDENGWRCEQPQDMQSTWRRKQEELMLLRARKKKAWTQSPVVDDDNEYEEEAEDEEVEECDALDALIEVLAAVVTEMWDMATDRRCAAAESHAQTGWMLGILEEI
ncbi:hypothetical protein PAXRUDRAFT_13512 [Paxillus rubicundulus Ve08.2h10]|uniref:Unplaced genomic scaffold scaffold_509, whole genome shotgun sequence n=1 Tax=Paxillus rubicundulus Ve08.2h10 TaxID=930991 RepID=A0A0D0DTM3_9AGAM|nr:hypothetical protein PAXRUDRAFT_13512 [Paxillus rubicundulus Ve08.2h10]